MKRPPGLWLFLTIVAVWLRVEDVYSLKATSLIFAKTTTTTTETPDESKSEETVTEAGSSLGTEAQNSTQPVLTGIPQIDYIYDPNLPRELNGYNLSQYPFYDRVPPDINFKCDGLHDGFYASVPHKCQVYHHCLFGIRYDFLCANYTAFDQKTFICHFVSEVDCVNSKKFWHRNDALYQAASTTTVKPSPPPPQIYTLPPAPATPAAPPILPLRPNRPRRPLKRPVRPYDYYEEDYAEEEYYERPYRRQRPKYRPRYEDEYEYEEEEYPRRPERRRPYKSRGSNRRRPAYDDEEYGDEDVRKPAESNRRTPEESRRPSKRRPVEDEEYDRRSNDRPRKKTYRRPIDDDYEEDAPPRRSSERRKLKNNRDEGRKYYDEEEEDRSNQNNREDRPRKNNDRNRNDDGDKPRNKPDRSRNEEAANDEKTQKNEKPKIEDKTNDDKPLTKAPISVYSRPRPMLKVRPPVPAHEQAKYAPKVTTTTTPQPLEDEEYYDEYEEDIKKKEEPRRSKDSIDTRKNPIPSSTSKREYESKRKQEDYEEEDTSTRRYNNRPKYEDINRDRRVHLNSRRRPAVEEDYEEYEETRNDKKTTTTTTTTTTEEPRRETIVKVVKRPFLPSRGGHPYTSRGLLPVGSKALDTSNSDQNNTQEKKLEVEENKSETKAEGKPFKPSPIVIKIPVRKNNNYNDEEFRPVSNRPVTRIIKIMSTTTTTTTTEKPKIVEKNPLDIDESEYDVTLNDALNPTLPNLPIRNFPTGFNSQNDYTYNTVPRQRYVIDPLINQASSDYVYRIEQPEQISNNIRYKSQNIPIFQAYRQNPRVTQAFYSPY